MCKITKNDILSVEALEIITAFLKQADALKNAYFWTAPSLAHARRSMEERYGFDRTFEHDGREYTLSIDVNCSCHHVYVNKDIYRDGAKTTQTVLNTLLSRHYEAVKKYSETA